MQILVCMFRGGLFATAYTTVVSFFGTTAGGRQTSNKNTFKTDAQVVKTGNPVSYSVLWFVFVNSKVVMTYGLKDVVML